MSLIDREALIAEYDRVHVGAPCGARKLMVDASEVRPEQGWVLVTERLPEKPFGCLVTVWDEVPMTGEMFENLLPYFVGWDGERWNDADGEQCPFEVIAWWPLPKPYRLEEQDATDRW